VSLSSKGAFIPEAVAALSKIVDDSNARGHAIASVKSKALGSTLLNFEYKLLLTAADSHILKNSGRSFIHVKMSILNKESKKEDLYMEMNLK
jgi:hypothetical protein